MMPTAINFFAIPACVMAALVKTSGCIYMGDLTFRAGEKWQKLPKIKGLIALPPKWYLFHIDKDMCGLTHIYHMSICEPKIS
ncbi:hypothetical protein TMES_10270 [Thalassospira mesophila]|uniref:Uncharacterized protein n=1 Tax=Thalassospira mesophila TaxID=1293891 RepID=A0A1Y2L1D3_9PROT|nr:hypothetical protein TMES_10270 [Thalassospira mesophila]